jgi:hypothetical protein
MTQLYYTPSSGSVLSSLQIIDTSNQQVPLYYYDVTILTSSISITIQSGSSTLGIYPISNTNLYYPPFPTISLPSIPDTSSYINLDWRFDLNYTAYTEATLSGSGYSLISGSTIYLTGSYNSDRGSTTIPTLSSGSETYTATVYGKVAGGGSYITNLFILSNQGIPPQNITALVSGSNVSSSATFTMSPSSSYTMYFTVTGSSIL